MEYNIERARVWSNDNYTGQRATLHNVHTQTFWRLFTCSSYLFGGGGGGLWIFAGHCASFIKLVILALSLALLYSVEKPARPASLIDIKQRPKNRFVYLTFTTITKFSVDAHSATAGFSVYSTLWQSIILVFSFSLAAHCCWDL